MKHPTSAPAEWMQVPDPTIDGIYIGPSSICYKFIQVLFYSTVQYR